MDTPPLQSVNATEVDATETGKRQLRSFPRKLVQSTLLPHKPQDQEENGVDREEMNNCREEEELCGSQGKKKRKSKGKTTPQSRSSKKAKEKRAVNLTPKKILNFEETTPTIPDLRLEAKMTREENSRMFAGRQMHPFFSSLKAGKKSQEATQSAERGYTVEKKETGTDCNPIHVFEETGDDELSLDWKNWTFTDRNIIHNVHTLQKTCSSVSESSIKSLSLDDLPIVLAPSDSAHGANEEPVDHNSIKQECIKELTSTVYSVDADQETMLHHLLRSAKVDDNLNKTHGVSEFEARPISEHQSRFLQDRMQSYYLRCQGRSKNCLWTYKYQPRTAMEVCGNLESVKFLSEWLHLWYERNSQNKKDFAGGNKFQKQDKNGYCSQSDSDYESPDGEDGLKNVLLVTGSSGSGKSAAVYACAEEHSFRVFEFSASAIRSGAVLKQMIGEALQSHQLKWSVKTSQGPRNNFVEKSSSLQESTAAKSLASEVTELIPLSDDDSKDYIKGVGEFEYIASESLSNQGEAKPLILLEDVDIIFLEDRGFISAIQEIADTGKGPIILTSNNSDPVLPVNLDRLQISFIRPSSTELLSHLYKICASEGVSIQPCLLERIIHCCHRDIRKTITHLQFWCQGTGFRDKVQKKYGSLLFDIDAGHQILPVIMPWSFPSQLSELVDKEITKSLIEMETTCLMETSGGEFNEVEMQNGLDYQNYEANCLLEAKKAAMLSRNGSIQDHNEFVVEFDTAHECSDISGAPIPLPRKKHRRRLDMVVSSDSEDIPINKECSLVSNTDDGLLSSHHQISPNYSSPLNGLLYHMSDDTVEDYYPSLETAGVHVNEMSMSAATSYVPESIFVPETEIHDMELFPKMISLGDAGASLEISMDELFENVLAVEANGFGSPAHTVQETTAVLEDSCNVFNLSRLQEKGFSCNGHMENNVRGYTVMDECSRIDFNKSKFVEKPELEVSGDSVQELWKQLRLGRLDLLGHHVLPEKKETIQIIDLVHRMSHLISDLDLLSSCRPQDMLETPTFEFEESDLFSWRGEQLQMASTIAHHGFSLIANDVATTGSHVGCGSSVDIVSEMLASTTNTAALGKLLRHSSTEKILKLSLPGYFHMQESRDMKACLFDVIQKVAPNRSYLSLKGVQFFEYLSSLRCISRSETLRISKGPDKTKRRRGRVARHYLSTGSHLFSPEDITLLGQSNLPYKDSQGC
ncbi:putative P-loop containing nucleoside triphosphate hydrolases superfamily protein [Cucumis melo var. makuwa]|uniref:P-loop containing nucleoside triphosphate hydrolases superfamily protein n=1 Tax=Cucumis melo var. makuwa TaxID=1194695 RepID=A0A5A7TUP8_CUCMM|nr:putative P-loop containing nucleoside triphosphate hydrolases superfamily protein [Cucumis melo var. makuwa]